jgi:hypothetical protein
MKKLLYTDLPVPKCKDDLINRVFPCPYPECGEMLDIGSAGIMHYGRRHMLAYNLDDIMNLLEMHKVWEKLEYEIWFGKQTPKK